ncbi:hypothetical protein ACOBQX_05930 [Actinokineospora sp. G85]|uniref:Rv3212 family protein n=1 Tax=Actinokineospora sp. G85 TaxID=3406626 RepID=UPI003C76A32D
MAVVAASVLVWQTSDIAATRSEPTPVARAVEAAPARFPPSLAETWRADSPNTPYPVVAGPVVATGAAGEVIGRDPLTGDPVWRYKRDNALCTVAPFDTVPPQRTDTGTVLALYATDGGSLPSSDPYSAGGCSEVAGLDGGTGSLERTRNSDAERGTRLLSDGSNVTTSGRRLLTSWRSDLVLSSQYGTRPTPVQPREDLRHHCHFGSQAVGAGKVAVVERCPDDAGADRLTVYKAQTPSGRDNDDIEEVSSSIVGARARVLAVTETHTAVALADPPRVRVYDADGAVRSEEPVDMPNEELANLDPPSAAVLSTASSDAVYWFTGSRTVALTKTDLRVMWVAQQTLGPGVVFAGKLVLPVKDALVVRDPLTGADEAAIRVDRGAYTGPVTMSTTGPILLEQRGPTLVALR